LQGYLQQKNEKKYKPLPGTQTIAEQGVRVTSIQLAHMALMVNPRSLADGQHDLFISGNDVDARNEVMG
jgi:hypothetical protein